MSKSIANHYNLTIDYISINTLTADNYMAGKEMPEMPEALFRKNRQTVRVRKKKKKKTLGTVGEGR